MDGVLTDFDRRWIELFNERPEDTRENKKFSPLWEKFVLSNQFETLDLFPGAAEVYDYVKSSDKVLSIQILSSTSSDKRFYQEVRRQKISWLRRNNFAFDDLNIVPGRRLKRSYATPDSIMIDDTYDVIESFTEARGRGILHRTSSDTISTLKLILDQQ